MIAAQDVTGHPLLCSIGTDKVLNMLVANSGETSSGWATTNLLSSFQDQIQASIFHLVQEVNGMWSIAFVSQGLNAVSTVFYASLLSNDLGKTDLTKLSSHAFAVEGIDTGFLAESIRIGASLGGARPLLTVEGSLAGKHLLYQLGADDGTKAQALELPEDMTPGAQNLLDHCTGAEYGYSSNYFLYKIGPVQRLIAIAQNRSQTGTPGSLDWDYSTAIQDGTCHCIATCPVPDTTRFSDLYFAGAAGVFRVADGVASLKERIADPVIVGEVRSLVIAHDKGQVAVWTVNSKDELYYTRGIRTVGSKAINWGMPIPFAKDITRVAPTRSFFRNTNELFCVNRSSVLTHYWQDPKSTLWRKRIGNEQLKATVVNFDSYTTHVNFTSDDLPMNNGMTLNVTSSELQYATINNVVYTIHDTEPVTVTPDARGNLTIICDAVDTAPPDIHISSASYNETLNIYPNGKLHKHLAGVIDGNYLQQAQDQGGKAVLNPDLDANTVDGVATRVKAVHDVGNEDFPPATAGNIFLVVESPANPSSRGVKHTLMAPIRPISGDHSNPIRGEPIVAMTFANGTWRIMSSDELEASKATRNLGSSSGLGGFFDFDWIGDAWHAIENAADWVFTKIEDAIVYVDQGIQFVLNKVKEGLELVVTYLGKAMTFVLNTFVHVFKAISALLKLIGIDIGAVSRRDPTASDWH